MLLNMLNLNCQDFKFYSLHDEKVTVKSEYVTVLVYTVCQGLLSKFL